MSAPLEPLAGGVWDAPLDGAALVFVDCEMTGLDVARDHVIEVCFERWEGGELVARCESLVRPLGEVAFPEGVHGLVPEALAHSPAFAELSDTILRLLDGAILVGHGVSTDVAFLQAEFTRAGREWSCEHFIDTLPLSRRAFGFESHRLSALVTSLGIEVGDGALHRAGTDVLALRRIFQRICEELRALTARDLWHVRVGTRHARPEVLTRAHEAVGEIPVRVRYRPSGRPVQSFDFVVRGVIETVDPPQITGYLVPGRGRRELRADRILSIEPISGSERPSEMKR